MNTLYICIYVRSLKVSAIRNLLSLLPNNVPVKLNKKPNILKYIYIDTEIY